MKSKIFYVCALVALVFSMYAATASATTVKLKDRGSQQIVRTGGATLQEGCSDVCQGNLCQNGSTCSAGGGNPTQNSSSACFGKTYKCSCTGSYVGSFCGTACQSPCASSMCASGSTCVVGGSLINLLVDAACPSRTFSCTCPSLDATTGYAYDTTCNKTCSGTVLSSTCCVNSSMTNASCLTALCSSACGSDYGSTADTAKCLQAGAIGSAANNASSTLVSFDGKYYAKTDASASGRSMQCLKDDVSDCAGWLASNKPDVAVAKDAASMTEALASGKTTIVVTADITLTSGINIGAKTLTGSKAYQLSSSLCSATPTITMTDNTKAGITVAGGKIEEIKLSYPSSFSIPSSITNLYGITGSGTLKNFSLEVNAAGTKSSLNYGINATGNMTLQGDTVIHSGVVNDSGANTLGGISIPFYASSGTTVSVEGPMTISGASGHGVVSFASAFTLSSGLSTTGRTYYSIYMGGGSGTMTLNGPLKAMNTTYAVDIYKGKIYLNKDGNYIVSRFRGIYNSEGSAYINGTTTIEFISNGTDNSQKTALGSADNGGSVQALTYVNKQVTVLGDTRYDSTRKDLLLDVFIRKTGGSVFELAAPVVYTGSGGIGIYLVYNSGLTIKSGGYANASTIDISASASMPVSLITASGAKLKIGSACRSTTTNGTTNITAAYTSTTAPPSPFTVSASCP